MSADSLLAGSPARGEAFGRGRSPARTGNQVEVSGVKGVTQREFGFVVVVIVVVIAVMMQQNLLKGTWALIGG